jgi:hypothetical protein
VTSGRWRIVLATTMVAGVLAGPVLVVGRAQAAPAVWTVATTPNASGDSYLNAVSCSSPTSCMAVGYSHDGSSYQTLIESYDGTAWAIVSSPSPGSSYNQLYGVSCTSATACVAVGGEESASTEQTLIETWDGITWSVGTSPSPGSTFNQLNGVSCASATSCVAVGEDQTGSAKQTLVETFDGTSWSVASSPDPGSSADDLYGVSCASASSCTAVGYSQDASSPQTLVESFDGAVWSAVASPSPGALGNALNAVSCSDPTNCTAVGWTTNNSTQDTLIESFDGTTWSVTAGPQPSSSFGQLNSVSCADATDCVAVGDDVQASTFDTLIESFDGTAWSLTASPSPSGTGNFMNGVSCSSPTGCVAAGDDQSGSTEQTLIETDLALLPVVSGLTPSTGLATGGETVTVVGSGFTGATAVDFGTTPATIDGSSGDTSLTVTVPEEPAGSVDVTVTAPGGTSSTTPADLFTYTVAQGPNTVSCQPTCTNSESSSLNDTGVSVTGDSGTSSAGPTTTLTLNTDTVHCGRATNHGYDYPTPVSTLSTTDFSPSAVLTVSETLGGVPSTAGVRVCYAAGSNTTGRFLHRCHVAMKAPCVVSLSSQPDGSVVATFLVPANDPRFWTGAGASDLKSFTPTQGPPGTTVTIKGKNLTQVQAVVIGGAMATIDTAQSTSSKLVVTVAQNAVHQPELVTVTAASGEVISTKPFTVT